MLETVAVGTNVTMNKFDLLKKKKKKRIAPLYSRFSQDLNQIESAARQRNDRETN